MALLLTMIAVTVAGIVAYSYLGSQGTSLGIARNVRDYTAARYVAESGMDLALAYVKANSNWRTAMAGYDDGINLSLAGGNVTIICVDGIDADGNGTIDNDEGDADLTDDPSDPVTLTVIGRKGQAACVIRTVLRSKTEFGVTSPPPDSIKNSSGLQIATQVTLDTDDRLIGLSLYGDGPPPKKFRLAIYSDMGGEPGALLAQTTAAGIGQNTPHWETLELAAPVDLTAGTYWLAFSFEHSNMSFYYTSTGGQTRVKDHNAVSKGFLSNWGVSDSSDNRRIGIKGIIEGSRSIDVDWQ